MSSHFVSETRDASYVGTAMCPECPSVDWRGMSRWRRSRDRSPEVAQGSDVVNTFPTFLGSVLVWSSRNIWDSCWPWGITSMSRAAAPATFPTGHCYEHEWILRWWLHRIPYSRVSFSGDVSFTFYWTKLKTYSNNPENVLTAKYCLRFSPIRQWHPCCNLINYFMFLAFNFVPFL